MKRRHLPSLKQFEASITCLIAVTTFQSLLSTEIFRFFHPPAVERSLGRHNVLKFLRWALYISRLSYIIEHDPGELNTMVQMMTRWIQGYHWIEHTSGESLASMIRRACIWFSLHHLTLQTGRHETSLFQSKHLILQQLRTLMQKTIAYFVQRKNLDSTHSRQTQAELADCRLRRTVRSPLS